MEQISARAVIELSDDNAKFILGYCNHGKPVVLYTETLPCAGISNGKIVDAKAVAKTIAQFRESQSAVQGLDIQADTVSIVVPSCGLQVYSNTETIGVADRNDRIANSDIINVVSAASKCSIPNENVLVDAIPEFFAIDRGMKYENPPVNQISKMITVKVKYHTLPEKYYISYKTTVEDAGFRIYRVMVSTYCAAEMIKSEKGLTLPQNYFYVDYGGSMTTVSIVGGDSPFDSRFFNNGGDDLARKLSDSFGISIQNAKVILAEYGYDQRPHKYRRPIVSVEGNGATKKFYQEDLNAFLANYYRGFDQFLANTISTLVDIQGESKRAAFESFPIVFSGGASSLHGLKDLLPLSIGKRSVYFYVPTAIGARDPSLVNVLGCLVAQGTYKGSLQENNRGVSTLVREDNQ